MRASKNSGKFILMLLPTLKIWHQMLIPANPSKKAVSGSERVFATAFVTSSGAAAYSSHGKRVAYELIYSPIAENNITHAHILKSAAEAPDIDETKLSAMPVCGMGAVFTASFFIKKENKKHIIKDGNKCAASSAKPTAFDEYIPTPTAKTVNAGPEFTQ